jgi:hypothetical protein
MASCGGEHLRSILTVARELQFIDDYALCRAARDKPQQRLE